MAAPNLQVSAQAPPAAPVKDKVLLRADNDMFESSSEEEGAVIDGQQVSLLSSSAGPFRSPASALSDSALPPLASTASGSGSVPLTPQSPQAPSIGAAAQPRVKETFPRLEGPAKRMAKRGGWKPCYFVLADSQIYIYKNYKDHFAHHYFILLDLVRDPNDTCIPTTFEVHFFLPGDIVKLKFDKREDLVTAMESINAANKIARSISVPGKVCVPVWFPDGSHTIVEVEIQKTTIEELWWLVCESITLPIQAREYFFIWGVGKDLELLLKAEDIVTDIQDHWYQIEKRYFGKVQAPIQFLFHSVPGLPLFEELSWKDPKLTFILYHQAVYHLRNGNYVVSFEEFMDCISYRLQADLGDFDPNKHRPGYIATKLDRWVPKYLKKVKKLKPAEWEQRLSAEHQRRRTMPIPLAMAEFLKMIRQLPIYGGMMFRVVNQLKEQGSAFWNTKGESEKVGLVLSVNMDGIHLMDPYDKKLQRHYNFQQVVAFQVSQEKFFWIEVTDPGSERNVEFLFRTPLASLMVEMIKEFVYEVHAFRYCSRLLR